MKRATAIRAYIGLAIINIIISGFFIYFNDINNSLPTLTQLLMIKAIAGGLLQFMGTVFLFALWSDFQD